MLTGNDGELSRLRAILDEILNHRRIGQCGGVAEIAEFVLRDLAQDAAHDLAGACLRQARRPLDDVGTRRGADLLAHLFSKSLAYFFARRYTDFERDIAINSLALEIVRIPHDRRFGDRMM